MILLHQALTPTVRFGSNASRSNLGFIGEYDSIHIDGNQAIYTTPYGVPTSATIATSGSDFIANFDGNYSVDEDITFTTSFNPTPDVIMSLNGTSSLNVAGSQAGYVINGDQLSDRLQGFMNFLPGRTFTLGGADAVIFPFLRMEPLQEPPSQPYC